MQFDANVNAFSSIVQKLILIIVNDNYLRIFALEIWWFED
jgi:hypothetical protein